MQTLLANEEHAVAIVKLSDSKIDSYSELTSMISIKLGSWIWR